MTAPGGTAAEDRRGAAPPLPVLLVVGADPQDVRTTAAALARRFTPDYRVLTAGSAASGLAELDRLARRRDEVALVAADQHLPDDDHDFARQERCLQGRNEDLRKDRNRLRAERESRACAEPGFLLWLGVSSLRGHGNRAANRPP